MDYKVPHSERPNAPFCSFVRQPACLRRRPPGGLMASDVRHSALGRVRGDAAIASAKGMLPAAHTVLYARSTVQCSTAVLDLVL